MTELCHVSELEEGTSRGFASHRGEVFAVKYDNEIHVYKNECPHLGVALEYQEDQFLDADGQLIECSSHGALFDIPTGKCLAGPCQGDTLIKLEFAIVDDIIVLR